MLNSNSLFFKNQQINVHKITNSTNDHKIKPLNICDIIRALKYLLYGARLDRSQPGILP